MNLALVRKNKNCRCRTVQFSANALIHANLPAVLIISFEHTKKQVLEAVLTLRIPKGPQESPVVHSEPKYLLVCLPLLQNLQSMLLVNASTCALDPIFSLAPTVFPLPPELQNLFTLLGHFQVYTNVLHTSHLKGKKIP